MSSGEWSDDYRNGLRWRMGDDFKLVPGVTCFRPCGPQYEQALMCPACPYREAETIASPEPRTDPDAYMLSEA